MKNKLVKMMALLTATTMVAAGVMGCGSDSSDASADANTDTTASDTCIPFFHWSIPKMEAF